MQVLKNAAQFLFLASGLLLGCNPPPLATDLGTPQGEVAKATIGAAGGTLMSADGKAKLVVPAGALSADVELGIQATSSVSPGGLGSGWRLTPDGQKFSMPATLSIAYTDEGLAGVPAEAVALATQRPDGVWKLETVATLDGSTKFASGPITHFSDWSLVYGVQMRPARGIVKVGKTQALSVTHCYAKQDDELTWLGFECDPGEDDLAPLLPQAQTLNWSVNGTPNGGDEFGSVAGAENRGIYTAPRKRPSSAIVAVSAEVSLFSKGKVLVVSNLTITDESKNYAGTLNGSQIGDTAYTVRADAIFVSTDSTTRFAASGMANVNYSLKCGMANATFSGTVPFTGDLSLNAPMPGKYSIVFGLSPFRVTCNGSPIDVTLYFNPCDNFGMLNLDESMGITGMGTCGPQQMNWSLAPNN
jgi:hypothetical protein